MDMGHLPPRLGIGSDVPYYVSQKLSQRHVSKRL